MSTTMTTKIYGQTIGQIITPGCSIVDIIYEDNAIIIINKPTGMLSVPGNVDRPKVKLPRFEEWRAAVKATYESTPEESIQKPILEEITKRLSIPRKRKLFGSFLERNFDVNEKLSEEIYNRVVHIDEEMHSDKLDDIPTEMISAAHIVEQYCGHRIYQVHRLDMETTGILVQAKTDEACAELCRQFREREMLKAYVAKVFGRLTDTIISVNVPIKPDYSRRPIQIVDMKLGKPSETLIRILNHERIEDQDVTLVHLTPVTGRTHQLRLHMDYIGHPILGDPLYGNLESKTLAKRLCLHAFHLKFKHPTTKEELEINLPYDDVFY